MLRVFIFCVNLCATFVCVAQHSIFLVHNGSDFSDYKILNAGDSAFIKISHYEDMGVRYGNHYRFKDRVPDGQYQVYLNDTLKETVFYKNHKPDGEQTFYYKNIKYYQITYMAGEIIFVEYFYPDGATKSASKLNGQNPNIRISYDETGKLKMLEYFVNHTPSRVEYIDDKGYVTSVRDEYNPSAKFISSDTDYKKGRLDGKHILWFEQGCFEVEFSAGKLLKWQYLQNGKVLNSQDFTVNKK